MTEGVLDFTGIADIITALTGLLSLLISLYLVLRITRVQHATDHVEHLTNSNFSRMQALLADAMTVTEESAERDRRRVKSEPDEGENGGAP